jgi:hypothetical protein
MLLSRQAETRLSREANRRSSAVSQAMGTYNVEERRVKLLDKQAALQRALEDAEQTADEAEVKAVAARERVKAAQVDQTKAHASTVTMRKLLVQLQECKVKVLQERAALFEEDESERARLSQRLQDHMAETSKAAAAEAAEAADDPDLAECRRLRAALIDLTDDFEAKHKAHLVVLQTGGAVKSTLAAALEETQDSLALAEGRAAEQKQTLDAIDAISHKINDFVEKADASKGAIGARTAALAAATDRRRAATVAVQGLKAERARAKKELDVALEERVAPAETAVQQAEATLGKLKALQKTLRLQAGVELEIEVE